MRLTNREISASFICSLQFIVVSTMVKYCAVGLCRNGSKKRPDLSYFCFPTRRNERKKWKVFCKPADKKFMTLCDPRICSLHFKESDIEIAISGRKSLRSGCYPTSLNQRSWQIRLVCVRSVLPRQRRCDEQLQAKKVCPRNLDFGGLHRDLRGF